MVVLGVAGVRAHVAEAILVGPLFHFLTKSDLILGSNVRVHMWARLGCSETTAWRPRLSSAGTAAVEG